MWLKVDDNFPDHPKLEGLEGEPRLWADAVALWLVVGCYCSRHGTDGAITTARLHRASRMTRRATEKAAKALVKCGLFEKTPRGFTMHDFLDYNPSSAEKADRLRRDRARKRASRASKSQGNRDHLSANRPPDVRADIPGDKSRIPTTPTRPDPTRPDLMQRQQRARATASAEVNALATIIAESAAGSRLDAHRVAEQLEGIRASKGVTVDASTDAVRQCLAEADMCEGGADAWPADRLRRSLRRFVELAGQRPRGPRKGACGRTEHAADLFARLAREEEAKDATG